MARVIDVPLEGSHVVAESQWRLVPNDEFVAQVLGGPERVHFVSHDKVAACSHLTPSRSLLFQAVHWCYSNHLALSLRPEVLWYAVVAEVATHVRLNSDRYANLFTTTPGTKQVIVVRDDTLRYEGPSDWGRTIGMFRAELAAQVPGGRTGQFLPTFSTSSLQDETALLVAFMDVVSPYYDFAARTLCGIPRIRLEGEAEDWQLVHERAAALAREFDLLGPYFHDLLPVLREIADTAAGVRIDEAFWGSLYKWHHFGSGGSTVTGWVTALLAHVKEGARYTPRERFDWQAWGGGTPKGRGLDDSHFPTHVSTVPFLWDYHGHEIDMTFAAGVLGLDRDGEFLVPRLGFAVAEDADPVDREREETFEERRVRFQDHMERLHRLNRV